MIPRQKQKKTHENSKRPLQVKLWGNREARRGEKIQGFKDNPGGSVQNGIIPKNVSKFKKIVGEKTIKSTKIITSSWDSEQIEKDCFITGLKDL